MRLFILVLLVCTQTIYAQKKNISVEDAWVNRVYDEMTLEEKIGQLFMVAAYSNKTESHVNELMSLVQNQKIGGVIFFQGGPGRQAKITNKLQNASKLPLFVGIDAEWGLSMRLDSTYRYPWNMSLGAVQDMKLLEQMGVQMAEQANRMGIHFTFGPVVDINTNAANPIIGNRSFGETREIVTERALAVMKGLQSQNVFATAKHFPGHGDTSTDSHHSLPYLDFSKKRLYDIELYPYKKLIQNGLASIMVAHLDVPAFEPQKGVPTSLSYNTITKILKEDLEFEGLIFTDALNMKAASNYKGAGEVDLAAFLAGNDVMLFSENVPLAIQKFVEAYQNGKFDDNRLEHSVKKILAYKYKAGLNKYKPIDYANLYNDLNSVRYDVLNNKLYENLVTVVKNERQELPLDTRSKIAYVKLGDDVNNTFVDELKKYANVDVFFSTTVDDSTILDAYDHVIVGFHKADGAWKKHDFTTIELNLLQNIAQNHKTTLVSFTKPYALSAITFFDALKSVVLAYQNNDFAQKVATQIIFGDLPSKGKLPVTINKSYEVGDGVLLKATPNKAPRGNFTREKLVEVAPEEAIEVVNIPAAVSADLFSTPEKEKMNGAKLKEIDRLAQSAIDREYTPGIQVLVARNGKIIYQKAYGTLSYDDKAPVTNETVYDLASLSKILGTLPMVMKLYDEGKINFNSTLGDLLPRFKNTDKAKITLKELLTHQSGLVAWIPFYKETLENGYPSKSLYRMTYSKEFPVQISENLYLKKDYQDIILDRIKESKLGSKTYKYSDLNFILLKEIVEAKYNKPLDVLVEDTFYKKIQTNLTYNPLQKMDMHVIAPTELDTYYRHTKIQGYVHDMGAAMFGGVGGHAGVFGNAVDVFKMMQFYLNGGIYNGQRILSEKTLKDFNTCYYCSNGNRRGAGFDKPQLGSSGPTCGCASKNSFGHTGFTGTMTWVDPEYNLVYVFLSNRTYPNADDNKLSKANTREDIQQIIYDAIQK